jgi:hypothetical protein
MSAPPIPSTVPGAARETLSATSHPAAQWAIETGFDPEQVDCTTAVVLKILDNKCKMLSGEKAAIMSIHDAVRQRPSRLFDASVYRVIDDVRLHPDPAVLEAIHALRVRAEAVIPKPVMKRYKAFLRDGLFG